MVSRTAALALLAVAGLVLAGSAPIPGATPGAGNDSDFATEPPLRPDWVLGLDGPPERTGVGTVGMDLAQSVSTRRSAATVRLDRIQLRERLDAASTDEERFEILNDELQSIDVRLDGLYGAEQDTLAAFRAGQISPLEYLERTAFLDARVAQYLQTVSVIEDEGERIQAAAIGRSVEEIRTRAAVIGGLVQERVTAGVRGERPPESIRIDAGDGGYVATTVIEDSVIRQSQRYDRRAPVDAPTNDLRASLDHVYARYPNETSQVGSISVGGQQSAGVFIVDITTSSSVRVTSFVDNRNLTVFKEVYRQPLAQLPTAEIGSVSDNGIRMVLAESTSEVLRVTTTEVGSGDAVDATVTVNGTTVGMTGPDGRMWILSKPGPTIVAATTDDNRSVSAEVSSGR